MLRSLLRHRMRPCSFSTQPTPHAAAAAPPTQPTGLKLLMSRYGKTALIVYFGISTIDLGLCYVLVQQGGSGFVEKVENFMSKYVTGDKFTLGGVGKKKDAENATSIPAEATSNTTVNKTGPSFIATFAVAYAIHKLLVPIRVPITAAITPACARWAVRRGWMKMPAGGLGNKYQPKNKTSG